MGYEQCKRDLRLLVTKMLPDAAIIEDEAKEEPTVAAKQTRWFGLRP